MSIKTKIPFTGTKEQEQELKSYIDENKSLPGAVMPILRKAQEVYGYLPIEVQKVIADELDMPLEEVYGIVTFYTQFTLSPRGTYQVSVCLGTACYVLGAGNILDKFKEVLGIDVGECSDDGKFSIEATRCIGACGLAPVCIINGDVYAKLTVSDIEDIVKRYA